MKGFAWGAILKQRHKVTWKWPIVTQNADHKKWLLSVSQAWNSFSRPEDKINNKIISSWFSFFSPPVFLTMIFNTICILRMRYLSLVTKRYFFLQVDVQWAISYKQWKWVWFRNLSFDNCDVKVYTHIGNDPKLR